jgi:hypothetical protein
MGLLLSQAKAAFYRLLAVPLAVELERGLTSGSLD